MYTERRTILPEHSKCFNALNDYYCNKAAGKDHLISNIVNKAINLMHVMFYKQNKWPVLRSAIWFVVFVLLETATKSKGGCS